MLTCLAICRPLLVSCPAGIRLHDDLFGPALGSPLLISWLLSAPPSLWTDALKGSSQRTRVCWKRRLCDWIQPVAHWLAAVRNPTKKKRWLRMRFYQCTLVVGWEPNKKKKGENLSPIFRTFKGLLCGTDSVCGFIGVRWWRVRKKAKIASTFRSFKSPNDLSPGRPHDHASRSQSAVPGYACGRWKANTQTNTTVL